MKLFWFVLLLLIIHPNTVAALTDLDITFIKQQIAADIKDFDNRLILARYYLEQKDISQVKKLLAEMRTIDPDNKEISQLAKEIKETEKKMEILRSENNTLKKYNISDIHNSIEVKKAILNLYFDKKFNELKELHEILERNNIKLDEESAMIIAQLSILEGNFTNSKEISSLFKNPEDKDFIESMADTCYSLDEFKCARDLYKDLFANTEKIQYGHKLIEIYLILQDIPNAEMLLFFLDRLDPDNQKTKIYHEKIINRTREHIHGLEENYKNKPVFDNFKELLVSLYLDRQFDRCEQLIKGYLLAHMGDRSEAIALVTFLKEIDQLKAAINVLNGLMPLIAPQEKLLLAELLSLEGKHDEALDYVKEVIEEKPGQETMLEAIKTQAYILLRKNEPDNARKLFAQVIAEKPDDEVAEEILILDGKIHQLIEKYEALETKEGPNPFIAKKLAQLYSKASMDDKAIVYYKQLVRSNPSDLKIYKILAELFFEKKQIVNGLMYLEYYARKNGSVDALFLLAEKYYLAGFNQRSVNVLEQLLAEHGEVAKAIDLKNKITISTEISKVKSKITTTYESPKEQFTKKYQTNSAQQLLHADKLYYKGFFKASLPYYQAYLVQEIEDNNVRYRYALALEKSSLYEEAAGEFYIMLWKTKEPDIIFRYAYNLEKTGRIKEAMESYREILTQEPKQLPEFMDAFLNEWKQRQEKKDFDKYTDLYADVLKKNDYWISKKQSVFADNKFIRLNIVDPYIISEEGNVYIVRFFEEFASNIKKDQGYRILELECNKKNTCLISSEKWVASEYKQLDTSLYQKAKERLAGLKTVSRSIGEPSADKKTYAENLIGDENLMVEEPRPLGQTSPQLDAQGSLKTSDTGPSIETPIIQDSGDKIAQSSYLLNYLLSEQGGLGNMHIGPLRLESSYEALMTGKVKLEDKFYETVDKIYHNALGADLYWYSDASDTTFSRYSIYFKNQIESFDLTTFMEAGYFVLKDERAEEPGEYLFASIEKYDLELGIYFYSFDSFNQFDPYVRYRWKMENHNLEAIFYRRNASLIIKYSTCPIERQINGYDIQLNDYVPLDDNNYFWGAIDFTYFDDSNFAATPQFNFYFHNGILGLLRYKFYLAGWYNFNTRTTDCYYSPNNYDSTFFGVDLEYLINRNFTFLGKAALGYSLSDNSSLYELGAWIEYELANGIYAKAGCKKQNSQENTALSSTYTYEECEANIEYRW